MQRSRLRASDADREAVAERLRNAAAEGRLLAHELEERVARALRASTYGELDAVVVDLPRAPLAPRSRQSWSACQRARASAASLCSGAALPSTSSAHGWSPPGALQPRPEGQQARMSYDYP